MYLDAPGLSGNRQRPFSAPGWVALMANQDRGMPLGLMLFDQVAETFQALTLRIAHQTLVSLSRWVDYSPDRLGARDRLEHENSLRRWPLTCCLPA